MIVEMRQYTLKPRTSAIVEERFAQALADRTKISPLGGFFHTDVGTLNQVIHLWPYESHAHREKSRAEASKLKTWPPAIDEFIIDAQNKVMNFAPFSPPMENRALGKLYELRQYTYRAWSIPEVIERWAPLMELRNKFSPCAGAWYTDVGPLNQWVHLWAYPDFAARQKARSESVATGQWPPDTGEFLVKQENMLLLPASFSPLH